MWLGGNGDFEKGGKGHIYGDASGWREKKECCACTDGSDFVGATARSAAQWERKGAGRVQDAPRGRQKNGLTFKCVGIMEQVQEKLAIAMEAVREWRFIPDVTPFSGYLEPWLTVVIYFTVIWSLQAWRQGKKPLKFTGILFVHNFLLSLGSLLLFVALVYVLLEKAPALLGTDAR